MPWKLDVERKQRHLLSRSSPRKKWSGWRESNVFSTATSFPRAIHFPPVTPYLPPPPPSPFLFLPLSRVISSFTFLVPAPSYPPSRAPLNRVFSLSNPHPQPPTSLLDLDRYLFTSLRDASHALGIRRTFNDTSEKF